MNLVGRLCLGGILLIPTLYGELLTRAETSDYRATSSHAEVVAFCEALAAESERVVKTTFGQSVEGRELPLLILSADGKAKPEERLTVLCLGNIHAGEVCGKEALLMLARELARAETPGILQRVTVLVAPIYNADGNEAMALDHRPGQLGPEEGMGKRENAQHLDLNRDYVKAEAPETRALLKLLREWKPGVVIDTHTTNGSHHRYTLTYGGPRHPNTDPRIVDYVRDRFLPKVSRRVKQRTGYETFYYGNFREGHQRWETYPGLPRYGAHYLGMRHTLAILSEAYAYAPYKDRVLATRAFVHECLLEVHRKRERIGKLIAKAAQPPAAGDAVVLRHAMAPFETPRVVKGYVEEEGEPTEAPRDYLLPYWGRAKSTLEVNLPGAYLFPESLQGVTENLQRHGIEVRELREDVFLTVTEQRPVSRMVAERAFQGHHLVDVKSVGLTRRTQRFPAGTRVVEVGQSLGRLAAFLLEPQAEDGLATWGALSAPEGEAFPVSRLEGADAMPLLTGPVRPLPEDRETGRKVTFDVLYGEDAENFSGNLTSVRWLDDGVSFLQRRGERWHRVDALTGQAVPFLSAKKLRRSLRALEALTPDEIDRYAQRQQWSMNPSRSGGLLTYKDDLYHVSFEGEPATRLTAAHGKEELATYSPDGAYVAFVRDHNLHVVNVRSGVSRALTTDGGGDLSNGKADWVYFEELYGRDWRAFWWSPDSRHLAYHRFDRSALPFFHALDTLPLHGELQRMRHPKPGDPNPEVKLGVVHVAGGPTSWVDLSAYTAGTFLVSHVGWRPEGEGLYYYVQDRAQTWLDFMTVGSSGGGGERWFRETTEAWVESPGEAHWLQDGVMIASERSGWRHLYHFHREKGEWKAVTQGEWEVRRVHRVDETEGVVWLSGTKDSPIAENLYCARLDGEGMERLTEGAGTHRVQVAPEGRHFVDRWSDFDTPPRLRLHDGEGALVRVLDTNPVYVLEEFALGEARHHQIATEDGFQMEAVLTTPPDFDAAKRYPAWFRTYAGPQAPTVRNAWSGTRMLEQMLAQLGMVVFRMDPRSASGKGAVSAWSAYRRLGQQEMYDIRDGIGWLTSHAFVDADRVGMHGHSYGGFMTAYAMTHSDLFAAGISGAPVTDWRYYDSIYTERYMNTPEENPEGYEATSVVKAAKHLHGRLLLLHGMMDDNVHLQNSTQLMHALQEAGKDFELMLYPTMKHGLYGEHYQRLLVRFIRRHLLSAEE